MKTANLALRFLLELTALAALAYSGAHAASALPIRIVLAVGLPLAAAVLWGAFVAPKARVRAPLVVRYAAEFAVFGGACIALVLVHRRDWATMLGVVVLVNEVLLVAWDQRTRYS